MSGPTLLERLGALAAGTSIDGLPPSVAAAVPPRVLDIIGLEVAATRVGSSRAVMDLVAANGGRDQASAVGLSERVPAAAAAFVGGVLAHSLDYDDTHLPSILHPSAPVVPAALAAGEAAGSTGAEVVVAVAVGIEVTVRLGMAGVDPAASTSVFFEHGQHATSICGCVGAAAAAAMLLAPGDAAVATHAMGVACSMSSGIIEANRTGGTVKRLHCGWAAQSGVTAAQLAAGGITGAPTALEGRFGFFEAWLRDQWRPEAITDGLGREWAVERLFFKPYPANHFTHTGADAARRLRRAGLRPEQVERAHLGVATSTARTIGEPLATKQRPETGYQAQFSGPYVVAAALFGGSGLGLGLADFTDELATDPARRDLMARITVGPDERCDAIYPHQFPAVLTVETRDGRTLTEEVLVNRGGPDDPLTDAELAAKFADNTAGLLDEVVAKEVVDAVGALSTLASLDAVVAPLRDLR